MDEEQHPIPQQISSYQFRLVGDMTLKQFFEVAGGALVALSIYSSALPAIFKWPLILIAFLLGVGLAFFPLEDRPLEKWILSFFKTIYSPTLFVWKITDRQRKYYSPETEGLSQTPTSTIMNQQVQGFAKDVLQTPEEEKLEESEQQFLASVDQHFEQTVTAQAPIVLPAKPSLSQPQKKQVKKIPIPQKHKVGVEHSEKEFADQQQKAAVKQKGMPTITPMMGQKWKGAKTAQFSEEVGPPIPPAKPNVIVGQVMDSVGKIVPGAILEIKDEDGRSVRALRTNLLGHFLIVTPLQNGKYEILTEKEGFSFYPISLAATGKIIPPIAIKASANALDGQGTEAENNKEKTVFENKT